MRVSRGIAAGCSHRCSAAGHAARPAAQRAVLTRSVKTTVAAQPSVRQPKDPKAFKDMDELRDSLHRQPGFQLSMSSVLNWFSEAAMGYNGQTFRFVGRLYKQLTQFRARGPAVEEGYEDIDDLLRRLDQDRVRELQTLMLCSSRTVAIIARKYPPIMTMQLRELGFRMIALKTLLPGCDAARLVELQPRAFLGRPQQQVAKQVKAASRLLRTQLPGADVDRMIQEDPVLLFSEITSGLTRLRELWDVDEQALRNSNPGELALAIRALSDSGPPRKF